jgi:hypothetical protein
MCWKYTVVWCNGSKQVETFGTRFLVVALVKMFTYKPACEWYWKALEVR